MRVLTSVFAVGAVLSPAAEPAVEREAAFLGASVYARAVDCEKWQRLQTGTPRTADSVPEVLTAKGYQRFDAACRFTNIDERYAGRLWTVTLSCSGSSTTLDPFRTEVWRKQPDGSLVVTLGKTATTLVACTAAAPAAVAPPTKSVPKRK